MVYVIIKRVPMPCPLKQYQLNSTIPLAWVFGHFDALPVARQPVRITRYSSNSSVTYIPKKCRTLSYQHSFFVRCARIRNVLPESLKEHNQTPLAFKRSWLKYYTNAVDIFDQEDIRTWRTICPKCNTAKTLTRPPHCCFRFIYIV